MRVEPGKDGIFKGAVADDGSMYVKCPLCGGLLPVHVAVNGRPYLYCGDCGLKAFVNYPRGQDRLREILKAGEVARNE